MYRLMVALLLALTAVTITRAGAPIYFNEARVTLSVEQVRSDSRYASMAKWFGLSQDVFNTHNGCVENIPVGSDGKFRWGQNMEKPYQWPSVTPQESAMMPGVTFDLGDGFFLHAQKGCDGNAILFYGKYCLKPTDGRDGKDGGPGPKGDKGDTVVGPRGPKGDPGETIIIERPIKQLPQQPVIINNISYNLAPANYGSAQMMGMYGATSNTWQLMGVSYAWAKPSVTNIDVSSINNNSNSNANTNVNNNPINIGDGSATGHASGDSGAESNSGN